MKKISVLATCTAALLLSFQAHAWTNKPVKMLVPAPAGGTMDIVARILADQLSADIGQTRRRRCHCDSGHDVCTPRRSDHHGHGQQCAD
jgi:hypothetical protein